MALTLLDCNVKWMAFIKDFKVKRMGGEHAHIKLIIHNRTRTTRSMGDLPRRDIDGVCMTRVWCRLLPVRSSLLREQLICGWKIRSIAQSFLYF